MITNKRIGGISILVLVFGVTISIAIGGLVLVTATLFTAATRTHTNEPSQWPNQEQNIIVGTSHITL
jgi:hypothetical protein